MILDFAGVAPNPARDRVQVKLPREEPTEMEPPSAEHVEKVGWLLQPDYLFATLVLDATGVRVGELEAATLGDLDETRQSWLVRAAVSKTRRARWVALPDDCSPCSSSGYRLVRTATPRRRCSRASPPIGCVRRSPAPAATAAFRTSHRTRSVIGESRSCTVRASHGRTSANGSGNARSSSPQTPTPTRCSTHARSNGKRS